MLVINVVRIKLRRFFQMSFAYEEFSLLELGSSNRMLDLAKEFSIANCTAHKQLLNIVQLLVADVAQCHVMKSLLHGTIHFILQEEGLYIIGMLVQVLADEMIGPLRRVNETSNNDTCPIFTSYSFCSCDLRASFSIVSSPISISYKIISLS
jgi:hypothetical protein